MLESAPHTISSPSRYVPYSELLKRTESSWILLVLGAPSTQHTAFAVIGSNPCAVQVRDLGRIGNHYRRVQLEFACEIEPDTDVYIWLVSWTSAKRQSSFLAIRFIGDQVPWKSVLSNQLLNTIFAVLVGLCFSVCGAWFCTSSTRAETSPSPTEAKKSFLCTLDSSNNVRVTFHSHGSSVAPSSDNDTDRSEKALMELENVGILVALRQAKLCARNGCERCAQLVQDSNEDLIRDRDCRFAKRRDPIFEVRANSLVFSF
eukprot:TRINITY_DN14260_c0_g1_i1.p1 TRINITY_DN14260_c0_g1~~TRINITY_DN14260_c0_g1_i1.p1  ORF type:complete len:260 (-),score=17.91 TRINITY_DN14260_c0_g1_i1:431-1210(-)